MLGGIVIGNQVGGGWGGGLVRPLNHHDPPARIRQRAWIPDPRRGGERSSSTRHTVRRFLLGRVGTFALSSRPDGRCSAASRLSASPRCAHPITPKIGTATLWVAGHREYTTFRQLFDYTCLPERT